MTRRRLWLLIVGSALVVLVGMGSVRYGQALQTAREATLRTQLHRMRDAIDHYHRQTGRYPPSLAALVEARYLRAIPEDPITKSSGTWRLLPAETAVGFVDVKSGAPGRGGDGTPFSDW